MTQPTTGISDATSQYRKIVDRLITRLIRAWNTPSPKWPSFGSLHNHMVTENLLKVSLLIPIEPHLDLSVTIQNELSTIFYRIEIKDNMSVLGDAEPIMIDRIPALLSSIHRMFRPSPDTELHTVPVSDHFDDGITVELDYPEHGNVSIDVFSGELKQFLSTGDMPQSLVDQVRGHVLDVIRNNLNEKRWTLRLRREGHVCIRIIREDEHLYLAIAVHADTVHTVSRCGPFILMRDAEVQKGLMDIRACLVKSGALA